MRALITLLLISLFGFFIDFTFLGQIGNFIFKLVLFCALAYLLFRDYIDQKIEPKPAVENQTKPANSVPKTQLSVTENIISKKDDNISSLLMDESLGLNTLLLSQFEILFNFLLPNNGYVFIESAENEINLFYKKVKNDIKWKESEEYPYVIKLLKNHENDILIENHLSETSKVLPYYDEDTYSPSSVFALRIYLSDKQALYFVFDSAEPGFFNSEDSNVPVQAGYSLQYAIKNAVKQKSISKQLKDKELKLALNKRLNNSVNKEQLITHFVEFLSDIFEAHKLTVALIDPNNRQMATIFKTIGQIDSIKEGTRFVLDEGLCGKVILNEKIYLLDDIEKDGYFIPRFSKNEKTNYGLRSFLGIPLKPDADAAIGMISVEHKNIGAYNNHHKNILKNYIAHFENALNRYK